MYRVCVCLNASKSSEHPPQVEECLKVCVVISFILDVRFVSVPAGVTHEEGHTGFLHLPSAVLALIFIARRIQPFLSLVKRQVELALSPSGRERASVETLKHATSAVVTTFLQENWSGSRPRIYLFKGGKLYLAGFANKLETWYRWPTFRT